MSIKHESPSLPVVPQPWWVFIILRLSTSGGFEPVSHIPPRLQVRLLLGITSGPLGCADPSVFIARLFRVADTRQGAVRGRAWAYTAPHVRWTAIQIHLIKHFQNSIAGCGAYPGVSTYVLHA